MAAAVEIRMLCQHGPQYPEPRGVVLSEDVPIRAQDDAQAADADRFLAHVKQTLQEFDEAAL